MIEVFLSLVLLLFLSFFFFPILIPIFVSFILGIKTKRTGIARLIPWIATMVILIPICLILVQVTTTPLCGFPDASGRRCEVNIQLNFTEGFKATIYLMLVSFLFFYLGILIRHLFRR